MTKIIEMKKPDDGKMTLRQLLEAQLEENELLDNKVDYICTIAKLNGDNIYVFQQAGDSSLVEALGIFELVKEDVKYFFMEQE